MRVPCPTLHGFPAIPQRPHQRWGSRAAACPLLSSDPAEGDISVVLGTLELVGIGATEALEDQIINASCVWVPLGGERRNLRRTARRRRAPRCGRTANDTPGGPGVHQSLPAGSSRDHRLMGGVPERHRRLGPSCRISPIDARLMLLARLVAHRLAHPWIQHMMTVELRRLTSCNAAFASLTLAAIAFVTLAIWSAWSALQTRIARPAASRLVV